jgi:predicted nucleic acid-binding protein
MILFDSSVIIDAVDAHSNFHEWAKEQISEAVDGEGAAINAVVLAETCVKKIEREKFADALENSGLVFLPLPVKAAIPAAKAYAKYLDRLKAEGKPVKSKIPLGDFFIGAHAAAEGMKLATRDPARVATYFPDVELLLP